ncbi:hypothetical protein HYFRA_00000962 [Hymenoscyphus fraxineus]|uniref:Uncharacterized protein n=1 Tax=Hymenoscyphus fraxineus TaxID=746836 RepID=A0A9N9PS67_9HELO|nr:hypothetical protein HYFRA_00000962 [Hymenoscyphus fraxineus]
MTTWTEQQFLLRERALRRRLRQTEAIALVFAGVACVVMQQLRELQWGRDGEGEDGSDGDEDGSDEDGSDEDDSDSDDENENGDSDSNDNSSDSSSSSSPSTRYIKQEPADELITEAGKARRATEREPKRYSAEARIPVAMERERGEKKDAEDARRAETARKRGREEDGEEMGRRALKR